jgi:hypothetical protein
VKPVLPALLEVIKSMDLVPYSVIAAMSLDTMLMNVPTLLVATKEKLLVGMYVVLMGIAIAMCVGKWVIWRPYAHLGRLFSQKTSKGGR